MRAAKKKNQPNEKPPAGAHRTKQTALTLNTLATQSCSTQDPAPDVHEAVPHLPPSTPLLLLTQPPNQRRSAGMQSNALTSLSSPSPNT